MLAGLQHTPHGYCEAPQLCEVVGWDSTRFWVGYQAKQLDGVCYAGLQLMPHGAPKLQTCLHFLGRIWPGSMGVVEVAWLGGVLCAGLQLSPPSSGDFWLLGVAGPKQALRDLPEDLQLTGDVGWDPSRFQAWFWGYSGWMGLTV